MAFVPVVFLALAEGWGSLGGGEKDIILVFPFALWSIVYAITFGVMWLRHNSTRRCVGYAVFIATVPLPIGWLGLLNWSLFQGLG